MSGVLGSRRWRALVVAIAAVWAVVAAPVGQVGAAPAVGATGAMPDLASGWGSATACLVWTQGGVVECFASQEELRATEAQLRPVQALAPGSASPMSLCYADLRLFSGPSYSGSELDVWDVGTWVNLAAYGFANVTVSFSNGSCQAYLAKGPNGTVAWYPNSGPWASVANMGLYWNDSVQSVFIS